MPCGDNKSEKGKRLFHKYKKQSAENTFSALFFLWSIEIESEAIL